MRLILLLTILIGCSHRVNVVSIPSTEARKNHLAQGSSYMVSTQGDATSRAAMRIFEEGGNIIDAFVAASFAISVERPQSTGIGGGGFLLFYNKKENKVYSFDFREVAPVMSHSKMYLTPKGDVQPLLSQEGALAVATPGLVAGLYDIHTRFGKMPWRQTMQPAIELARRGFPLYGELKIALSDREKILRLDPEAREIFLLPEGGVPHLGTIIVQEQLAKTLELIAQKGKQGFYQGRIADSIVKTVRSKRGILAYKDLRNYQMKERVPVEGSYKGLKIFSMPPPSSGGIHVIQILKMLEPHQLKNKGPQSTESVHLTANSMQRAFVDRALYLGDPDFHAVPVEKLLDEKYLNQLSNEIATKKAIPAHLLNSLPLSKESSQTTHFSLADKEGNMVATTQTINGWFGSGVMAKGTGIVLNNEMDDFAQKVGAQNLFGAVGGDKNLVQPKKRPLSSMSPTIITDGENPVMALGSPSGTRIITCVAQTILNSLEFEMPLYESVAATRIHQQWMPDELKIEAPFLSTKTEEQLTAMGHKITHGKLGCSIQAIKRENNQWIGVSDPRGEGRSIGL